MIDLKKSVLQPSQQMEFLIFKFFNFTHTEKNSESDKTLSRVVPEFSINTLKVNKIDRSPFIYSPGGAPRIHTDIWRNYKYQH